MPNNILTRGPSSNRSMTPTINGIANLKDAIDTYWKNGGDEEGRNLYHRYLKAQAQLEHVDTLNSQANLNGGQQPSAEQKQNFDRIRQQLQAEADTTRQTLEQKLGDDRNARSLLFREVRQGGQGAYKALARELGATDDTFETPEWEGSYGKMSQSANDALQRQVATLETNTNITAPPGSSTVEALPESLPRYDLIPSTPTHPDLMRQAMSTEMQQQFQGARHALGQQLQTRADAQRLAFSQELLPQLTGEAVMMGHFGSSRQGIAEGIARGRMESQLASEQAAAVSGLESNIANMQNQWGLEQLGASHQFALQDMANQQAMAQIGVRAQTDIEVARQKGLVDMDIARLQGNLNLDLSRQQNLMNQENAARQGALQQSMAEQQAMQAWELEKWRREEDLKEKQWSADREEAQQLRLRSVDSEHAMALEQFRGQQSLGQAINLEELRNRQSQEQAKLQAEMDMKKTQMASALNIFSDVAKVGVMEPVATPQSIRAAAIRKELGLPELPPEQPNAKKGYTFPQPPNYEASIQRLKLRTKNAREWAQRTIPAG
ncbi:MAG: hypothetical protein HQL84_10110 [Magnetococcales bacterium]|nr:hypothetical protein [Magnetococcales bacterium]MBF0150385.1 hypothetical protein [Magnetococcales bacterium]MBF0175053.1 hypothetical protein [Magnetococcales bacterium]